MEDDALHVLRFVARHPGHATALRGVRSALVGAGTIAAQVLLLWALVGSRTLFHVGVSLGGLLFLGAYGLGYLYMFVQASRQRGKVPHLEIELTRQHLRIGARTLDLTAIEALDPDDPLTLHLARERVSLPEGYTLPPDERAQLHRSLRARLQTLRSEQDADEARQHLNRLRGAVRPQ